MTIAIGLMSGTSLDGVDLALIETDGEGAIAPGPSATLDCTRDERDLLRRSLADARGLSDRHSRPGSLAAAEAMVTDRHAGLVETFLRDQRLRADAIDVVGFHGQTVLHRPEARLTVQIGDGPRL